MDYGRILDGFRRDYDGSMEELCIYFGGVMYRFWIDY